MGETVTSHLQFRRRVYAEELWVEGTPEPPQRDNHNYTRLLIPWLQREMEALLDHERDQLRLMAAIQWELSRVDLPLVEFTDTVRRYLGPKTSHFLHEYFAFMASQLTMEEYDLIARYPLPVPSPQVTSDDECQVVGVVKPRSERTPEIVDLSRDDDDDDDASAAEMDISSDHSISDPVLPTAPERHSPSYSPPFPPYCPTSSSEWSSSPSFCSSPPSDSPSPPVGSVRPRSERAPEILDQSRDDDDDEWPSSPSSSPPYDSPSPPVGSVRPRSERAPEILDQFRDDDDDDEWPSSPSSSPPSDSPSPPVGSVRPRSERAPEILDQFRDDDDDDDEWPSYTHPSYYPSSPPYYPSSPSYFLSSPPYCPISPPYTPASPPSSSNYPLSPTYSFTTSPEYAPTVTPPTSPSISSSTRYKTSRQFSEEGGTSDLVSGTKKAKRQKLNKK